MAKIPFSIEHREKIESGEYKVETKSGRPIRVLAWDLPCDFPIATAEFTEDNRVIVESYSVDGWVGYGEKENNLVIVTPEPELSEFEKKLSDVFGYAISMSVSDPKKPTDEFVREYAQELLAIARKELYTTIKRELEENPNGWVQRVEDAHNSGLKAGYKNGRAEALRDLPRGIPNKFDKHNFETCKAYLDTPRYLCYQDKMIDVSELVEKLPGFYEDEK